MKKNIFFIHIIYYILFLSFLSCSKPNENSSDKILKIMSFNIRYGTANDGENSWPNRKDFLFEIIKNYNPDILGVQEALDFQLEELSGHFPNFQKSGVGRDDGKNAGEHAAIFFDSTTYTLLREETFWFSETPDQPGSMAWGSHFPRVCSLVELLHKDTHSNVYVFNNHWDHESQLSRENSAQMLLNKIAGMKITEYPVIVMGDFNAGEDNPAFRNLVDNSMIELKDGFRISNPLAENVGTFNQFKGITTGDKIDGILVSSSFTTITSDIIRINKKGGYPSDHFPVVTRVSFK